jgi:osmotically-inducible protein OsmY
MLDDANIHAQAKDGEVVLHGTVNNKQQENRAVELARAVNGVRAVRSELVLKKKGE